MRLFLLTFYLGKLPGNCPCTHESSDNAVGDAKDDGKDDDNKGDDDGGNNNGNNNDDSDVKDDDNVQGNLFQFNLVSISIIFDSNLLFPDSVGYSGIMM